MNALENNDRLLGKPALKVLLVQIDVILGSRILLSILNNKGYEARCLQINTKYSDKLTSENLDDVYNICKEYDVVGLSFNSFYSIVAFQLGTYLKEKGIKCLICGGPHPTALPEDVLRYADIVVVFEADITLPRLLECIDNKISYSDIGGLYFKDSDGHGIINTGSPKIVYDLDSVPFQSLDFDLISYYHAKDRTFTQPSTNTIFQYGLNYLLMTSRGCPFSCTYCSNNLYHKIVPNSAQVRKRSIKNIIAEMNFAKEKGFESITIADDNFFSFTLDELKEFSQAYKTEINLPLGVMGLNPNNLRSPTSEQKLDLLLGCGLSDIRIGIQSGSNRTLELFKRRYKAEDLPKLVKILATKKTKWPVPHECLRVAADFICDSPWETNEDKIATLKVANNLLPLYGIFFYTLIYLPGTDIFDQAKKNGWIKDFDMDVYLRGIAGVEDNIYNRLMFLVAVLKERGASIPDTMLDYYINIAGSNTDIVEDFIDFAINMVNSVENHHGFTSKHLTVHPYLTGFNKWEKKVGQIGKKVLFRSYHEPYG